MTPKRPLPIKLPPTQSARSLPAFIPRAGPPPAAFVVFRQDHDNTYFLADPSAKHTIQILAAGDRVYWTFNEQQAQLFSSIEKATDAANMTGGIAKYSSFPAGARKAL